MTRPHRNRTIDFDVAGFARAIEAVVRQRGTTFVALAYESGVHEDTVYKMRCMHRVPDGVGLAALGKWSGIDPSRFSIDRLSA